MNQKDRGTVLVTGGSRGIGRAIVSQFAVHGHPVAFTYQSSRDTAEELVSQLEQKGHQATGFQADVRDFERAGHTVEQAEAAFGPIAILVNNAGIKRDTALFRMKPEAWTEVIETNLGGTFNYTRSVIYGMLKRKTGVVLNIVSVSGLMGLAGQTNYSASKAGIIGFTKALAKEVARFRVRVNAIAPGFIDTEMLNDIPEAARTKMFEQIPMGSLGSPEQVARAALFLASEGAHYITGQILPVDGGLY